MRVGRSANSRRIEAYALDGSGGTTTDAGAVVVVGEASSYAEAGWKPPEWGVDRSDTNCLDEEDGRCAPCLGCSGGGCPLEWIDSQEELMQIL